MRRRWVKVSETLPLSAKSPRTSFDLAKPSQVGWVQRSETHLAGWHRGADGCDSEWVRTVGVARTPCVSHRQAWVPLVGPSVTKHQSRTVGSASLDERLGMEDYLQQRKFDRDPARTKAWQSLGCAIWEGVSIRVLWRWQGAAALDCEGGAEVGLGPGFQVGGVDGF